MNNEDFTKSMNSKIEVVYLDMDGVLSDFMSRYREVNGEWKRDREGMQSDGWSRFCKDGHFATLDTWPGWSVLTTYIDALSSIRNFRVEILTSTGGPEFHELVTADKTAWCQKHGLPYKVNTVPGRWHKKDFANETSVLIDDTPDVIDQWKANGGIGILHTDANQTITQLCSFLDI